jgi:hypothetical protein
MANESPTDMPSANDTTHTAGRLFAIGAELLREVQTHVGPSRIKLLRLTLGGRTIKDIAVSPATAVASVVLILAAVIISNLRIEVVKDTDVAGERTLETPTNAAVPGGAL